MPIHDLWLRPTLAALLLLAGPCARSTAAEPPLEQGLALARSGEYAAALPLLDQALASGALEAGDTGRAEYGRGSALAGLGRLAEAEPAFRQALRGCEDASTEPPRCAEARIGLAHVLARRGDFAGASALIDATLAALPGPEQAARRADIEYGFAVALSMAGDHVHAIEVAEQALASEATITPARVFDQALVRFLLGTARLETGRADLALPLFEAAAAGFAEALPAAHPAHAMLATNRGNALLALERLDESAQAYREALSRYPAEAGAERLFPRSGLATLALWRGEAALAAGEFAAVQAGIESALGAQSAAAQFVRAGHAAALWGAGELEQAYALADASEQARRALLAGVAPAFAERQALALKSVLQPGYEWLVAMAASAPTPARVGSAWQALIAARGEVATQTALRRIEARAADDPALRQAWQEWLHSNESLADALIARLQSPDAPDPEALRRLAEQAERALAREVGALALAREEGGTQLRELQRALPPDSALVVHIRLRQGRPEAFDRRREPERFARRAAFVLLPEGEPSLLDLGPAAPIDAAAEAWAAALRDPALPLARVQARGATLHRLAHAPLALPRDLQRLFLIADGALARVNLAALPMPDGRFLIEQGLAVHTLEHERDLLLQPSGIDGAARLLLVGAAQGEHIGGSSARLTGCDAPLPPLPQVAAELDAIAALWQVQASQPSPQRLDRGAATREAVRAALPGGGILHLATHGLAFAPECRPQARSVLLGGASGREAFPALAMDGGGERGLSLLGADEIAALDLSGTAWAVLSACETGLGSDVAGEGVFGLRRAFRIAGARSVIMSLWPVQDAATAEWMAALYRARLVDGASTIDSVASAQRELLAARRARGESDHPYYWAGFVSAGDWR
jgi:tetratricopeptide (TPR) repeat protein